MFPSMELGEPAGRMPAGAPSRRWSTIVLLGLVILLFGLTYARNRTGPAQERSNVAELSLDNLLVARQVYALIHSGRSHSPSLPVLTRQMISGHWEAAYADPNPDSVRRLALCLYMVGDPRWRNAIARLPTTPLSASASEIEREMALWRAVLDGTPNPDQLDQFAAEVRRMDLGWYTHIALEAGYRRAGLATLADHEAHLANRSSGRLVLLGMIAWMAGLMGAGIWVYLGSRFLASRRQYQPPISFVERLLLPRAPWPLTEGQRGFLYYLFLSYLGSLAILRLAVDWLGLAPLLASLAQRGAVTATLLAIALSLLPLAVPVALYFRFARRLFIQPRALGFCTANWKVDVLCGVAGYVAAVPLVFVAKQLSETLFRGMETPVNPAISAFAGSESALYQALIFLQAALLAPLIEETLFRGLLFQSVEHRLGMWRAAALASGVFALLHPQLPLGFLGIFVLGFVFNMLFNLRRSLLPAIVAHAINNGLILLFLLTLIRG